MWLCLKQSKCACRIFYTYLCVFSVMHWRIHNNNWCLVEWHFASYLLIASCMITLCLCVCACVCCVLPDGSFHQIDHYRERMKLAAAGERQVSSVELSFASRESFIIVISVVFQHFKFHLTSVSTAIIVNLARARPFITNVISITWRWRSENSAQFTDSW